MPQYMAAPQGRSGSVEFFGLAPMAGVCILLGYGSRSLQNLAFRYGLAADEFLLQEGVARSKAIVAQLHAQGIRTYIDMHVAHLRRQHKWLLDVPAPNRMQIVAHLQATTRHLIGTLALPAAGAVYAVRDFVARALAAVAEPVLEAAVAVVQHSWTKQDALELMTMATTLMVLWKLSAGLTRKKTFRTECPRVTFDEVIGMQAARQQVLMYVRYLQNPEAFTRLGARMPKGCLLAGPPGTGKTYLAKAVAGTAGVPFFAASGSDFMELFVGQGAKSVRELFQAARQAAPAVIFIDELDAVGGHRSTLESTGEHTRTINQLLAEMDGMALTNVVIFAATNRIDHLDSALLRPGRFDKVVHVEVPSAPEREQLFEFYLENLAVVDPESNWCDTAATLHDAELAARRQLAEALGEKTPNLTPAHISCICNEAALLAATEGSAFIQRRHFDRAVQETVHGVRESRPRSQGRHTVPLD
eukprot:EG_transcript_8850